jgi:DedD protein
LNQTTRQRITGSLVLAFAALVLLPVIFDGEGSYQPAVQVDIPARPQQPVAAQTEPQRPVITADSDAIRIRPEAPLPAVPIVSDTVEEPEPITPVSDVTTISEATPVVEPTPAPAQIVTAPEVSTPAASLDAQGLPEGWSVRLASFSSTANASALVTRLQAGGHRAYTRRLDSSQGILTAVFVGPLANRAAAQTLLERLQQDFQLNGMIVRYEIEPL